MYIKNQLLFGLSDEDEQKSRLSLLCEALCKAAESAGCAQIVIAVPCAKDCVLVRVDGERPVDVGNHLTSSFGLTLMFCTDDQLLVDPDLNDYLFNYGKVIYDRELTAYR